MSQDLVDIWEHTNSGLYAVVEIDEDGAYCAWVPDLPGCVAGGITLEEALSDLSVGIEAVLDVIKEDDPAQYDAIMQRSSTVRRTPSDEDAISSTAATGSIRFAPVAA